jgi:glycosyltransferase involved in cell wall biosynthesis
LSAIRNALGKYMPKVSVLLITYNHAKFLGRAIESVAKQITKYEIEINIIEDCSTDGTQDVARHYKQLYPDKVNLFLNEKNIGSKVTQKNMVRGFRTLSGDYFAILEGDDYWDDVYKLQKQVDFLESNPTYSACAHNTVKFYESKKYRSEYFLYTGVKSIHKVEDIIYLYSMFHTTTVLYRNVYKGEPPKHFIHPLSCDIYNLIAHVQHGPLRYFDDDMAMYRVHTGGMFSKMSPVQGWLFNINGLRAYNRWLNYKYYKHFCYSIFKYCSYVMARERKGECKLNFRYHWSLRIWRIFYGVQAYLFFVWNPKESAIGSMYVRRSGYDKKKKTPARKDSFLNLMEYKNLGNGF